MSPFQPQLTGSMTGKDTFYHGVFTDHLRANVNFYKKLIEVYDSDLYFGKATGKARAKFFLEDKENHVASGLDLTAEVHGLPTPVISHAFRMELPIHGAVDATLALKGPFGALEGRSDFTAVDGDMWGQKWDHGSGTVLFLADSLGLRNITAYTATAMRRPQAIWYTTATITMLNSAREDWRLTGSRPSKNLACN